MYGDDVIFTEIKTLGELKSMVNMVHFCKFGKIFEMKIDEEITKQWLEEYEKIISLENMDLLHTIAKLDFLIGLKMIEISPNLDMLCLFFAIIENHHQDPSFFGIFPDKFMLRPNFEDVKTLQSLVKNLNSDPKTQAQILTTLKLVLHKA